MISEDYGFVICDEDGCEEKIKNHAWGHIKAEGWFFGRDGETAWCPNHIPDWVSAWRAKKAK